jgi:uncharacterized protein YqeY
MLFENIKKNRLTARKEKNKYETSMLTTLVGELENKSKSTGKDVSDQDVMGLIKSYIKKNKEAIDKIKEESSKELLYKDNDFWSKFLPSQLSEEELSSIVKEIKDSLGNIGDLMKHLNVNYSDRYEGKMASQIFKSL